MRLVYFVVIILSAWVVSTLAFTSWGLDRQLVKSAAWNARGTNDRITQHGDTVIGSVKVYNIYWSEDVAYQSTLEAFLSSILQSSYMDWLVEYSTSDIRIGRGVWLGSTTIGSNITLVSQGMIINAIVNLIEQKLVPAPATDILYVVYFARGTKIVVNSNDASCQEGGFCGYHTALSFSGTEYPFAVIADCDGGCGDTQLDSLTATLSHEVIEAVTDTIPGFGWFGANTEEEVADLCQSFPSAYTNEADGTTWIVNPGWSNDAGSCVISPTIKVDSAFNSGSSLTSFLLGIAYSVLSVFA